MARSHKHCSSGKATMHSVRVVELRVTVTYLKILSVAQQFFYGKFVPPITIQRT
jgi:hypothetical protein